jgi:predicted ATP-grasp superfamily ATP-dependent carboligase
MHFLAMKISKDDLYMKGAKLVVPSVSATMVECFAIDQLIRALSMEKIAVISSPTISPFVASSTQKDPLTSCELFSNQTRDLFVLQIRSSIIAKQQFVSELIENFVVKMGIAEFILITGSDSCLRPSGDRVEWSISDSTKNHIVGAGISKYLISKSPVTVTVGIGYMRGCAWEEVVHVAGMLAENCIEKLAGGEIYSN